MALMANLHNQRQLSNQMMVTALAVMILLTSVEAGRTVNLRGRERAGPAEAGPGNSNVTRFDADPESVSPARYTCLEAKYAFMKWVRRIQARHAERELESSLQEVVKPELLEFQPQDTLFVVDKRPGFGNFTTVQSAIDSVPVSNDRRVLIVVHPGVYEEKVFIPNSKPYITLQGAGRGVTLITWSAAARYDVNGAPLGTYGSASFAVNSNFFVARNISFSNTAPHPQPGADGWQAVAARVTGDFAAFYSCAFYGAQDTLYDHRGRHYFEDCFIEGSIDYIFGSGQSLYVACTLHSIDRYGSLTAQRRGAADDSSGFSFVNCSVLGASLDLLGRAWGTFSRVVFLYTYFDNMIVPYGWSDWNDPYKQRTVFYGQYKCSGPGANEESRVAWSHELAFAEAQPFLSLGFIDGDRWLPQTQQLAFSLLGKSLQRQITFGV